MRDSNQSSPDSKDKNKPTIFRHKSLPHPMNIEEYDELRKIIIQSIDIISETDSPRLVILESWITMDYIIRQKIIKGLEIDRFLSSEFTVLPSSTEACIKLLHTFIKDQKKKSPINGELGMKMTGEYYKMVMNDEDFMSKIKKYDHKFLKQYYPNYNISDLGKSGSNKFRQVKVAWFDSICDLDKKWFSQCRKINKSRNKAAHSHNIEDIYIEMGIWGDDRLSKLKNKCYELLGNIVGIEIPVLKT